MATPLQTVKGQFGSKESLLDTLLPMLDRNPDEDDAAFRERMLRVSNKKLLRLLGRAQALRADHGSRESLIDTIVKSKFDGRLDADFRAKLLTKTTGRLLDMSRG